MTILTVTSGEHRLSNKQRPVGEFPTLRLAQEAAEEAAWANGRGTLHQGQTGI